MAFKILVADDDNITLRMIENILRKGSYDPVPCRTGDEAFEKLKEEDSPKIALLDWVMPGMQGIEICSRLREIKFKIDPYLIILTASMNEKKDVLHTFRTGANDYIEKPFEPNDLLSRIKIGHELVTLRITLAERMHALEEAYQHIKTLQGILPICMHCHKIRNDNESWERVEEYISRHTDAKFSHGLCPECRKLHYADLMPPKK